VFNRGVEKRIIFSDEYDYQRFLILMFLTNDVAAVDTKNTFRNAALPEILNQERNPIVKIQAFSLLPNHYHLLLSPVVEGGVALFMQKLATGYTMYFNTKHDRAGALFQGKYKIKHAAEDLYLKYLFEYIHLNIVRERFDVSTALNAEQLLTEAEDYLWSSLSVYKGATKQILGRSVVDLQLFQDLFSDYGAHKKLLRGWKSHEPSLE